MTRSLRAWALLLLVPLAVLEGCTGGGAGDGAEASEGAATAAIRFEELKPDSALRGAVEEQDQLWGDENIMNGTVIAQARKVDAAAFRNLDRVAKAAFQKNVASDEVTVLAEITKVAPFADLPSAIAETGRRVSVDGLVRADHPDNVDPTVDAVKALVAALGPAADVEVVGAESTVSAPMADDEAAPWRATTIVFANKRTRELVIVYARQGWI